jgi:flagellar motor switch protein FliN/FliY
MPRKAKTPNAQPAKDPAAITDVNAAGGSTPETDDVEALMQAAETGAVDSTHATSDADATSGSAEIDAAPTIHAAVGQSETQTGQESAGASLVSAEVDAVTEELTQGGASRETDGGEDTLVPAADTDAAPQAVSDPATEEDAPTPPTPRVSPDTTPFQPPDFAGDQQTAHTAQLDLLDDVELDVKIELGRTEMYIEDVLGLGTGSVVELDKTAGDPVDIFVNERLVARGEVLVLNDTFCVRINDILSPIPELEE